ncbi:N-formylglutamate amidohydrolase [Croceibacterium sp. LX-88]|uniref:N-formylglutamate amidohydrolase n=1 Tax=Croceibacterium selenioxidans TaxID=2838833 RepID=A0ABS5W0X2_9SPHN|nr:N-formylglutamate amidohydrolase [Croceibacterium selenioxidans]
MGPVARESRNLRGGSIPGTAAHPAFTLTQRTAPPVPVLIAVPHAGRVYPAEFAENFRHSSQASLRLEDRFADLVAEAVARETGASLLVAHAPRAMIDLNRAPDDIDWDMVEGEAPATRARHAAGRRARSGLGLVPRRLPGLGELWKQRMTREDLVSRIEQVHQPYHAALSRGLESLRDRWGAALLIDLHSMPPLGPKRGSDAAVDFVIGDRFGASASSSLSAAAFDHLTSIGRRAAHNRPYAGGYVLDRHASPSRGLHALQLEICRATYLDNELREPGPGLKAITSAVSGLIRRLSGELIGGWGLPQAAE